MEVSERGSRQGPDEDPDAAEELEQVGDGESRDSEENKVHGSLHVVGDGRGQHRAPKTDARWLDGADPDATRPYRTACLFPNSDRALSLIRDEK